ncbi:MAG TPA: SDR family NAD(P)-dependent oxidoreductase [Ktedonobacterales bacterium]|nr:SDR family NAD(P)-dependent oxidoreductase [Ktedonobacterales bacterium]
MKRVLLTGGTGFIGANLARRLINSGHDVHLFVRHAATHWRIEEIRNAVRLHEVDLADIEGVRRVVREVRPDWVFHLAVHGAYSAQMSVPEMVQTNVTGTINLVQACLDTGFEAFINTGSSSEYGHKDHAPSESEWLDPNSYYAITKAFGTHFCRYIAQRHHAPILTLRLYSAFGPFEEPTRLMPNVILRGLDGELPPLVDPAISRDFVYTEDVTHAYLRAASQAIGAPAGGVYNVGTGVQTSMRDLVDLAQRVLPIKTKPAWGSMPDRFWDADVWVANVRRISDELGWQPQHTLEQGFRKTVEWFRAFPAVEQVYRSRMSAGETAT